MLMLRFYVDLVDRAGDLDSQHLWCAPHDDAELIARAQLCGTGCRLLRVHPDPDAVIINDQPPRLLSELDERSRAVVAELLTWAAARRAA